MKTLFILLLPVILLAQPHYQNQFNVEFSIGLPESILRSGIAMSENPDVAVELLITVEIFIEEWGINPDVSKFRHSEIVAGPLPRYLDNYYLIGFPSIDTEYQKPQEQLNHLLALNDQNYPKEDTLQEWLQPVRYKHYKPSDLVKIPEGFGPRIRL